MSSLKLSFASAAALTILASLSSWLIGGGFFGDRIHGFRIVSVVPLLFEDHGGGLVILLTLAGLGLVLLPSAPAQFRRITIALCIGIVLLTSYHAARIVGHILQWPYAEPPSLQIGLVVLVIGSGAMLASASIKPRAAQV